MRRHTSHQAAPESDRCEWACACACALGRTFCSLRLAVWTCEEGNAQRRETLYVWGAHGRRGERRCMYGAAQISSLRLAIVNSTSLRLAIGTCEEETPLETVSSDQKLCRHQFQPRLVRSMKLKRRVLRSCTNLCSPLVELAGLSNLSKNNAGHNIICNLSNQNVKRTAQAVLFLP